MFEKTSPYCKSEMDEESAAHLCGCRCHSGSETVGEVIQIALSSNTCAATCQQSNEANYTANITEALNDKKWG